MEPSASPSEGAAQAASRLTMRVLSRSIGRLWRGCAVWAATK